MQLTIKNRDRLLFKGEVDNITSYNKVGVFNILRDHSNFITLVEKKIIINQKGSIQEFPLSSGLMKVRQNGVFVYVGVK